MTNNDSVNNTENERTVGQSILYWAVVYAITIPLSFVILGIIVRTTLTLGM